MSWKVPAAWRSIAREESAALPRLRGLGPRLSLLASWVPKGAVLADICTDHGQLPAALLRHGLASFAWATDLSPEALEGAASRLERSRELGLSEVRVGDGFAPLPLGEVDCAIIAGTGGETALGIVARGVQLGHRPERILIQPAEGAPEVRQGMLALGYGLMEEQIIADGDRLFLALAFIRNGGCRRIDTQEDLIAGPLLRQGVSPLYRAWLAAQLDWLKHLLRRPGPTEERARWNERSEVLRRLALEQVKMRTPAEPELMAFDKMTP